MVYIFRNWILDTLHFLYYFALSDEFIMYAGKWNFVQGHKIL